MQFTAGAEGVADVHGHALPLVDVAAAKGFVAGLARKVHAERDPADNRTLAQVEADVFLDLLRVCGDQAAVTTAHALVRDIGGVRLDGGGLDRADPSTQLRVLDRTPPHDLTPNNRNRNRNPNGNGNGERTHRMFNHEPPDYRCPFCVLVSGGGDAISDQDDIVARTERATAFVASRWWPNNHGHVLVIPNEHHENLYDLPDRAGHAVHELARTMAIAIRTTYGCDGISTRQHNEPAGYQDAWHYHVHVFPRYAGDNLYGTLPYREFVSAERRRPYAEKLRAHLT